MNDRTDDTVNNGVCKAGSATTQEAQEEALVPLFDTLVQFDPVYVGHFKCNLRRMADDPNLVGYVRDLYQHPGVAGAVDLPFVRTHYYGSHTSVNPTRLVPMGPEAVSEELRLERVRLIS